MFDPIYKEYKDRLEVAKKYGSVEAVKQALMDMRAYKLAKFEAGLRDVQLLMAHSRGIEGLHLNGDVAPWSEIEDTWLRSFHGAMEIINADT